MTTIDNLDATSELFTHPAEDTVAADYFNGLLGISDFHRTINGASHAVLTAAIYSEFNTIMERRRIRYSTAHNRIIFALAASITQLYQGRSGRIAWPIPTGGGKSTVAIATAAALYSTGLSHLGLLVAQNRVESLCELKLEIIEAGVPAEAVSLIHSKGSHAASVPSSPHDPGLAGQVVLVTHQKASDYRRLAKYVDYRGHGPRVVLWDETLTPNEPKALDVPTISGAVGMLRGFEPTRPEVGPAADYLERCAIKVRAELVALREAEKTDGPISFDKLDYDVFETYRSAVENIPHAKRLGAALEFLDVVQGEKVELRTLVAHQGGAVVAYTPSVPRETAPKVMVLDASWLCKRAVNLDMSISDAEELPAVKHIKAKYGLRTLADLKSYEQVDITQVLHSGGFDSIVMNDLNGADKADAAGPKVLPLVVDWIVKSDAPVLVYSFKQRQGCAIDPSERLRKAIKMAGHGVLLSKRCEVSGRDWISFATHGNETATNEYNHAGLVILWGVLHDSEGTMAARKLAAVAEKGVDLSRSTLLEEHSGEKHHRILQALSRGAMRNPDQNNPSKASPMRALVIDGDKALMKEFARLLPGVKFTRRLGLGKKSGVMELGAGILEETLLNRHGPWPTSEAKRFVEKRLGEKIPGKTWRVLRDAACAAADWTTTGSGRSAALVPF